MKNPISWVGNFKILIRNVAEHKITLLRWNGTFSLMLYLLWSQKYTSFSSNWWTEVYRYSEVLILRYFFRYWANIWYIKPIIYRISKIWSSDQVANRLWGEMPHSPFWAHLGIWLLPSLCRLGNTFKWRENRIGLSFWKFLEWKWLTMLYICIRRLRLRVSIRELKSYLHLHQFRESGQCLIMQRFWVMRLSVLLQEKY